MTQQGFNFDPTTNPWYFFVAEDPDLAFNALRPTGGPRSFRDFVDTRGQALAFEEFQRQQGQRALRGEAPNQEFLDFLPGFDFRQRFLEERGTQDTRRFRPFQRFQF